MDADGRLADRAARHAPAALLAIAIAWLAWREGGQHVRDWGWVALAVWVWVLVGAVRGRVPALRTPAGIAAAAGAALALWTAMSIGWAEATRHEAWLEAIRTATYVAALCAGAMLLAAPRALGRAATWTAIGALVAAGMTVYSLVDDRTLEPITGGRLGWPVGYANGLAALCVVGMWLLLGRWCSLFQAYSPGDRTNRTARAVYCAAAVAGATLLALVAAGAQSRGGLAATALAAIVALVAVPARGPLLAAGAIVAAAVAACRDRFTTTFTADARLTLGRFEDGADVGALEEALLASSQRMAVAIVVATVAAFLLGLALALVLLAWRDRRGLARWQQPWAEPRDAWRRLRTGHRLALALAVAGLLVVAVAAEGSAPRWASEQWRGCLEPGDYNRPVAQEGEHHLEQVGTNRCDFWRVALVNVREQPATGVGAGNFGPWYALRGESPELPTYAHSLPLQLLGELGIFGFAFGAVVVGAAAVAAARFVRSGPTRDATTGAVVAAVAGWAAHAGVDWLWQLPVVTVPVLLLAGGLLGMTSAAAHPQPRRSLTIAGGIGLVAATAAILAPTLADGIATSGASSEARLRLAARLEPTWAEPKLQLARRAARDGRAEDAAREALAAVEREPAHWLTAQRAARLVAPHDPEQAAALSRRARRLNPQSVSAAG